MMDEKSTVLQTLSAYAAGLKFGDLPPSVIDRANDCFFDFVGCYYASIHTDNIPQALEGIAAMNPQPQSTIWGTGLQCGIAEAALAMGTAGYHLEYDDGISVSGHWGSASIPATFLATAKAGGDGKTLLTALVAAYEVGTRISRMFSPRLLKKHIHFPCMMGAFGAATGYASAIGASGETLLGALSLAGLYPVGTYSTAIGGAQGKGLYSGWPNYLGVKTMELSQLGLTGDADSMEASDGFARAVGLAPMTEEYLDQAVADLGKEYLFMQVYFKPYPCCRWLHAPVHAALELMQEHHITKDQIASIDIGGPEFAMMYNTHEGFESKVTCQYSIPYSVGAAVYHGQLGLVEYEAPARSNPELDGFIQRINMYVDEELQANFPKFFGVKVKLNLTDGRVLTAQQGTPWGPDSPPSKEELVAKFKMITASVLTPEQQQAWETLYRQGFHTPGAFEQVLAMTEQKI